LMPITMCLRSGALLYLLMKSIIYTSFLIFIYIFSDGFTYYTSIFDAFLLIAYNSSNYFQFSSARIDRILSREMVKSIWK
jgi:hypothetical protein